MSDAPFAQLKRGREAGAATAADTASDEVWWLEGNARA
jgi:hypothetical protein